MTPARWRLLRGSVAATALSLSAACADLLGFEEGVPESKGSATGAEGAASGTAGAGAASGSSATASQSASSGSAATGGSGGCSADLTTDPMNCGSCGHVCATGLCGTSIAAMLSSTTAGWQLNGAATLDTGAGSVVLATNLSSSGSIVYESAIVIDDFELTFEFKNGSGTGGDGIAFLLTTDGASALGGVLGVGLNGFGVELDTHKNTVPPNCNDGSGNELGIDSLADCDSGYPKQLLLESNLPFSLRDNDWHTCTVHLDAAGAMSVALDGSTVLAPYSLPGWTPGTAAWLGFGGYNGGSWDRHEIRNVSITFPTPRCL